MGITMNTAWKKNINLSHYNAKPVAVARSRHAQDTEIILIHLISLFPNRKMGSPFYDLMLTEALERIKMGLYTDYSLRKRKG